jgi:hypothetical protein
MKGLYNMKPTKQVSTSIPSEYATALEECCSAQERSIAWYIKRVLIAAMKRDGIIPKKHKKD